VKTFRSLVPVLLFLSLPALLLAQHPVGGDLQVSVDTHAAQRFPHVATNRSGEFVVTWVSAHSGDAGHSLHATRFHADGSAATGAILASDQVLDVATNSAVALMDDGSFVVVFPTLDGASLVARWFDSEGTQEGADVLVTAGGSLDFSLSEQGKDGVIVAWEGRSTGAWFRVLERGHNPGAETLIDPAGTDPVVAVGPQGGFVVAWRHGQIVGRRFTALGVPSGRRFVIDAGNSGAGAGAVNTLHIGKEEDGDFLVLWGPGPTVFGRRFKADATPIGGLVRVQAGAGYDAAIGGQGNFVLTWEAPDAGFATGTNVFARRFKSDGSPLGPQVRVNEHVKGSQAFPRVGIGADGGFTVVWQSQPAAGASDVFARRFERK
jgi:hypothetical protein